MSITTRVYKSNTKTGLAHAYGYQREQSLVARIRSLIHRLTDDELLTLGEWTGGALLLPAQVEILVKLLGTPSKPDLVYTEIRHHS